MKEFPLRSVCKICVGGLRGPDTPAKTLACATGSLSGACIWFSLVLEQLRSRSKTQGYCLEAGITFKEREWRVWSPAPMLPIA